MWAVLTFLLVASASARDRIYIKRPIPPKVSVDAAAALPILDNGLNHGCVPDRALVEACVVKYQKNTKEVFFLIHCSSTPEPQN